MRTHSISVKTKRHRKHAFLRQKGLCYYCKQPMWQSSGLMEFASAHKLDLTTAQLRQCTGEHLHELKHGGPTSRENIVAACLLCNRMRDGQQCQQAPLNIRILFNHQVQHFKNNAPKQVSPS